MAQKNMLGTVSLHEARGVIGDLLEKLAGDNGEVWLKAIKRFLRKENPWGELIKPHIYFRTRPGLHVWKEFAKWILPAAEPATAPDVVLREYNLPHNMTDTEIRKELGDGHVFEHAGEFCAILARMLDAQWNGEEGDLLTNCHVNIFYVRVSDRDGKTKVFAVRAYYFDYCGWDVRPHRLNGGMPWIVGYRAFSANTVPQAA